MALAQGHGNIFVKYNPDLTRWLEVIPQTIYEQTIDGDSYIPPPTLFAEGKTNWIKVKVKVTRLLTGY